VGHYGQTVAVTAQRRAVLATVYAAHPERFVRKPPEPPATPTTAASLTVSTVVYSRLHE
jgi:putative transposase